MDPSTLEMWLILKNNKDIWNAKTIDDIINQDEGVAPEQAPATPVIGQKRQHDKDDDDNDADESEDEDEGGNDSD